MVKKITILLLLTGLWILTVAAQDGKDAAPAEEKPKAEKREIIIENANRMIVEIEKNIIIFQGNVRLRQGNTLITGDRIQQIKKEDGDLVVGDGNIRLVDEKKDSTMTLISQHLEYNTQSRHALITGNPVLEDRAKADEKQYRIVKARELEVFMDRNRSIARGDVEVRQENMTVRGQLLEHFGDEQLAVITGNPEVRQGENIFRGSVMRFEVPHQRLELTEVEGVVIETAPKEEKSPGSEATPGSTSSEAPQKKTSP